MIRSEGRSPLEARRLAITPDYTENCLASVLVETGRTKVLCTVSVEDSLPPWMRQQKGQKGWLTAEYSMLPGSTQVRSKRERGQIGGRTQEIQRLIGRALRGVFDCSKCPDKTFIVDCDVLQADGGTRTASITGSYVALAIATRRLLKRGQLRDDPVRQPLAAVSVGIIKNAVVVDLDYNEDSTADLDMNVVMTGEGRICELQGTAENGTFTKAQVVEIIDAATEVLTKTMAYQAEVIAAAKIS